MYIYITKTFPSLKRLVMYKYINLGGYFMWKKFKELRLVFKIIVGIIAFIFFPVTLLLFAIELFIRSIKNKKYN